MIHIQENKIYIRNFKKIISIENNKIILKYSNYLLIEGENLKISYLSKDDIEIIGKILKVEFYE